MFFLSLVHVNMHFCGFEVLLLVFKDILNLIEFVGKKKMQA